MTAPLKVALRAEVERTTITLPSGGESEMLAARWAALPLPRTGTPERAPVDLLLKGPTTPAELDQSVAAEGITGLARWMLWASRARERGLICYRLQTLDGAVVADLVPTATRTARPDEPRGGTYRFADVRAAPPAVRPTDLGSKDPSGADQIVLEPPDLAALMSTDPPLARVMEDRVSGCSLGRLTLRQLSEFCYRTMRVRGHRQTGDDAHNYPMTSRPYPSAGGMYEFTTYLAVDDCEGLSAGLYRYDPINHSLDRVAAPNADVERLLLDGAMGAALRTPPPVLVILAADFRRLSWKYEGIAYALTLKNAGVLFAMMQLVATAMRLQSCPVGIGDSDLFARAAGTRALEQSSIGEFLLGSRNPGPEAHAG